MKPPNKSQGKLFIVSAPSGAGKTTLVQEVIARLRASHGIERVITYTTKQPRHQEVHGVDYHFVSESHFKQLLTEEFFVEHSCAYGAYYGFPQTVLDQVEAGSSFIAILDRAGAAAVRAKKQDAVLIWISPPSKEALEQRLARRGQDTEDTIKFRLALAEQELCSQEGDTLYDHIIMNEDFQKAVQLLEKIVINALLC